eukprot:TRINITY_DN4522_c0_g1_i1.p1 TRINITY_DN4522_c0_g1~~TRINITY_DN4522_c0_g1_i1.p1  ORF type:complete len:834 (-),score=164.22 TRINITY_DN4522_c0_g1_i1:100-2601(-)
MANGGAACSSFDGVSDEAGSIAHDFLGGAGSCVLQIRDHPIHEAQLSWDDTKPAAFVAWASRNTPWRQPGGGKTSGRSPKATSHQRSWHKAGKRPAASRGATPSTRAPSRALEPWSPTPSLPEVSCRSCGNTGVDSLGQFCTCEPRRRAQECAADDCQLFSISQDKDKTETASQQRPLLPRPPKSPAPSKKAPGRPRRTRPRAVGQSTDVSCEGALDVQLKSWAASSSSSGPRFSWQSHKADRSGLARLLTSATALAAGSRELPDDDLGQPLTSLVAESQDWSLHRSTEKSREQVIQGLQNAADELGERARGPVALAIRAKAVCRLNMAAASRRLLHLGGLDSTQSAQDKSDEESTDDELDPWAHISRSFKASDLVEEVPAPKQKQISTSGSFFGAILSHDNNSLKRQPGDRMASLMTSPDQLEGLISKTPRKGRIEVLNNTSLGRMVAEDPKRAQKYGLVLVPSWSHNKPWPPPPITADSLGRRMSPWSIDEDELHRRVMTEEGNTQHSRMTIRLDGTQDGFSHEGPNERWNYVKTVANMVNRIGKSSASKDDSSRPTTKKGTLKSLRSGRKKLSLIEQEAETLDYTMVLTKLEDWGTDTYMDAWYKATKMTPGYLTSSALCKVLTQVGMAPTDDKSRKRLAQVQQRIIEDFRSDEQDWKSDTGLPNPLADKKGGWTKTEFLAMIAVCKEMQCLEQRDLDKAVAEANACTIYDVQELRQVYRISAVESDTLNKKEFVGILRDMGLPEPTQQDMMIILKAKSKEELTFMRQIPFTTFVSAVLSVQRALDALQKALEVPPEGAARDDEEEEDKETTTRKMSMRLSTLRRKTESK